MSDYILITNNYYEIFINKSLEKYGNEILEYSTNKLKEYLNFFKEESYGEKIKCALMTNKNDFFRRIKEVLKKDDCMPSKEARGCFCGGEIQILLDIDNPYELFTSLAHETFHLLFSKFVYEKNNWNRIFWLDEALAYNFDEIRKKVIDDINFKKLIIKYFNNSNRPNMEDLDNYNDYEVFKIVGRYLIETKTDDELLEYINNLHAIENDKLSIFNTSLEYFFKVYNI